MKKVRYLAGLAGIAPVAAGFLAPAAAHATATAQTPRVNNAAKTVSLHPAKATTATGCTGSQFQPISRNGDVAGGFWYTDHGNDACVGTVFVSVYVPGYHIIDATVAGVHHYGWESTNHDPGYISVHTSVARGRLVCVGASNTPGYACTQIP